MATFFNQASLSWNGGITNSNVTEGELLDSAAITKTLLSSGYRSDGSLVYAISLQNNSSGAITNGILVDNLGEYTVAGGATVYPLNYIDGSLVYYVNGELTPAPTVTGTAPITISGINIPSGANALLIYEAEITEFAPTSLGSTIVNTATFTSAPGATPISDSATATAEDTESLTIAKAICPAVVTDQGELTYTFIIQNSGNTEIVATDNVTVSDVFNPILNPISVTYNGAVWTEGVNYTYSNATGEFATLPGQITVPAATYTQDPTTGVIVTTPGVAVITVTGTV